MSAYLRTVALGHPGLRARRQPRVHQIELAQVLGLLGRVGGNVNQLAKAFNTAGTPPTVAGLAAIRADVQAMSAALMQALGHPPA